MNKNTFYAIFLIIACGLGLNSWINMTSTKDLSGSPFFVAHRANSTEDYKDIAYVLDGEPILLKNGFASAPAAPGSASLLTTRYFGDEARADLNGDGKQDIVFLLTRETGGSGIFYYVAVAMSGQNGYVGSEAYYIGDRIAPQTINIDEHNTILVNYADRKPGDSFAVQPSVGETLRLKIDSKTMRFGIVANIVGEANPAQMSLDMKTWSWIDTRMSDGTHIIPKIIDKFTLSLLPGGKFSAHTDCNSLGGKFTTDGNRLVFSEMNATLMFCDASQEQVFTRELSDVTNYAFTDRGELILGLKSDSGKMTFK